MVIYFATVNALVSKAFQIVRREGVKGLYSRLHRTGRCADGFDQAHGIETGNPIPIWKLGSLKNLAEASPYQAITVETFDEIMRNLPVRPEESTFIDLGSGKGKALILALEHGFKKAIGVEFSYDLCAASMSNLSALGMRGRAEVVFGSASEFRFPSEPTVVFMFNPFGPKVLARVLHNLYPESLLVYAHPKHAELIHFPELYRSHDVAIFAV
jgi:SAM-dependent methyltransferase